jgi:hypothetical protein
MLEVEGLVVFIGHPVRVAGIASDILCCFLIESHHEPDSPAADVMCRRVGNVAISGFHIRHPTTSFDGASAAIAILGFHNCGIRRTYAARCAGRFLALHRSSGAVHIRAPTSITPNY